MKTTIAPASHRPLLLFLSMLVLLVPASGHGHDRLGASVREDAASPSHNARFQFLLDGAVRGGLPGVSLRVSGPGIDYQGAAGAADLSTGEPLTTNHVMYTASIGKTFTAAIALQLCEEGRLDLEAPITTWLQSEVTKRIPSSEKITLRHLLSHTSGVIDYMNDDKAWRSDFVRDPHRQWTHSDVVPYLYHKPLLFEPGSNYHYSNSNYILVGLIIEQVARQPLHMLIRKRILAPLGMQHTFSGDEIVKSKKRAHGYVIRRGRIIDTYPWYSHYGLADSGIHSTPGELAMFIKSLFNTEKILSQAMLTEMTSVSQSGYPPSDYGMGIYVQRNPWGARHRWYTHDGIDPGYQADMMHLPELDLTLVLAANASLGKANFIYEKLIATVVQVALDTSTRRIRPDDF
jgi:D-alanyl-D-alanine carboxypeptidase